MLTIRCAYCHKKLLKYQKIGEGKLIYCWKDHIIKNQTIQDQEFIICTCGKIIGKEQKDAIKLRQSSVTITGNTINKKGKTVLK